jgi:hypothetical protein
MVPLQQLMAQWRKHEGLLSLDVDAYVAALEARGEDLSLGDVRGEIKVHSEELAAMEGQLVPSVNLGIAQVNSFKVGAWGRWWGERGVEHGLGVVQSEWGLALARTIPLWVW